MYYQSPANFPLAYQYGSVEIGFFHVSLFFAAFIKNYYYLPYLENNKLCYSAGITLKYIKNTQNVGNYA